MSIQRLLGVLLAGVTAWALGSMPVAAQSLFVANGDGDSVFQYNLATGASSAFASAGSGGLDDTSGLTLGPDGNLYVTGERNVSGVRTGSVFRYNGTTGAFIDLFVADTGDLGSFGIKFGPDGNLYVANLALGTVSRFNGTTGTFIDNFVASPAGGLNRPRDLVFGPDGHLYVANPGERDPSPTRQVRRFNGTTGALIDVFASGVDARGLAFGPGGDLYVANFNGNNVLRFDGVTGAFKAIFASGGGLSGPVGVLFGNDGYLYVSSINNNQILRYDGSTGAFIDVFASGTGLISPRLMVNDATPPLAAQSLFVANGSGDSVFHYNLATGVPSAFTSAGSGGLDDPAGLAFGPGKNLYVTGERNVAGVRTDHVYRYNGTTGAFIDVFANAPVEPLATLFGIKFGPDGNLYVANIRGNSVLRFNGTTGVLIDNFIAAPGGGLNRPRDLVFGPDGHLYVASPGEQTSPPARQVLRFNGTTGAPMGVFASGVDARGLAFGPGGDLYVANFNGNNVLRFDGGTGAFKAIFASDGGLSGPVGVLFGNDGYLYVGSFNSDQIFRYDGSTGAFIDVFATGNGLDAPRLMVKLNDTTPPMLNLPANFAVPATSPAGAAVNYTVTATDNGDPTPKVSCSPLSGAIFPIGTTTVNCTAKDASGNSSTPGRFTITIDGASEQLLNLISNVGVYSNPFLGITNSLTTKLQNAVDALNAMNKGSELRACNSLSAFINEAQAQSGKKLMPDGAQLIASAIQIRAVLGCP